MTLLIDHAAFYVALFAVLRSYLELLTALRGWGSHIQDERDDEDDEQSDDDGNRKYEIACGCHLFSLPFLRIP